MSDTRRDARFDEAIDRAVREMLDVEPPPGLRGRVMHRIGRPTESVVASAFRRKAVWIAGPLAAAAILVLAVLMPSESGRIPVAPPARAASDVHLPTAPVVSHPPQTTPQVRTAKGGTHPVRGERGVQAAVVAANGVFADSPIKALPGPAPLAVEPLTGPPAPTVRTVDVMPIQIRALEVNALTETPRERREE
jgi:hypothetical protein